MMVELPLSTFTAIQNWHGKGGKGITLLPLADLGRPSHAAEATVLVEVVPNQPFMIRSGVAIELNRETLQQELARVLTLI